jgi:rhamnulose-1-phosphate aldolase
MSGKVRTKVQYWLDEIAAAGRTLHDMGAAEGAAGNLSLFLPDDTIGLSGLLLARMSRQHAYPIASGLNLPAGAILISGSRRRLRDLDNDLDATLCAIEVEKDGSTWLHHADGYGVEPTSEIDSHLAIHATGIAGVARINAVVHAQPPYLTYLSHIPDYQDEERLNRQLLRWEPETIVNFPDGFRTLPYVTPGTPELVKQTGLAMLRHQMVVWNQHGIIVRSDRSLTAAIDLIEYAEAAARYEVMDIQCGRQAVGLSISDLQGIVERFGVETNLLESLPEELL